MPANARYRVEGVMPIRGGVTLSGALANVLDRFGDGLVTDFIQVGWWPTFNVADSCITVGVGVLLFLGLMLDRRASPGSECDHG